MFVVKLKGVINSGLQLDISWTYFNKFKYALWNYSPGIFIVIFWVESDRIKYFSSYLASRIFSYTLNIKEF